jgi:hypothetical protein
MAVHPAWEIAGVTPPPATEGRSVFTPDMSTLSISRRSSGGGTKGTIRDSAKLARVETRRVALDTHDLGDDNMLMGK